MKSIVENMQESKKILNDFYEDLDDYQELFESIQIIKDEPEELKDDVIIEKLKELVATLNSFVSTNKNISFADGETSAYINCAQKIQQIINKDF